MGGGTLEVRDEPVGQPFGHGIERAQERVQVLLRAAHGVGLLVGSGWGRFSARTSA